MPMDPNSDLVIEKWLSGISGLSQDMVASTLPRDVESWADVQGTRGFVVYTVLAGNPDLYLPIRQPVAQVDFWAANLSSGRAPWGAANYLAELVRGHVETRPLIYKRGFALTSKGDYRPAIVREVFLRSEPRRGVIPGPMPQGDSASYARYMMDMEFHWIVGV